jgi:SAM-dependent methyltransferase
MDEINRINRQRWNALAEANVEYSRPFLEFTEEDAAKYIFRHGILHSVEGLEVLCLASGGGQDSVAFGLLGARVTVVDLSDVQLQRDQQGASHHGLKTTCIQGDMRDLSFFDEDRFDIVWQPYSINFVPSVEQVFDGVKRVLKSSGVYFLQFANPFTIGVDDKWDGKAYLLDTLYIDGEDLFLKFPTWDVEQPDGSKVVCASPHEYRHSLSTVLNGLSARGFKLAGLWEWQKIAENPPPGSWAHFTHVAPPWFSSFWVLEK